MMNGVVGKNTHRALDINEFRAFTMVDEWAPLVFINAADSNGARLFSLLHEAAHIWLGVDDLYNDRHNRINGVSAVEIMCNAVAASCLCQNLFFWVNGTMMKKIFMRLLQNWQDIFDVVKV